jgi:hypothetical protein
VTSQSFPKKKYGGKLSTLLVLNVPFRSIIVIPSLFRIASMAKSYDFSQNKSPLFNGWRYVFVYAFHQWKLRTWLLTTVGKIVGLIDGRTLGFWLGPSEETAIGLPLGEEDGSELTVAVGTDETVVAGNLLGWSLGDGDGLLLGCPVGKCDDCTLGVSVGFKLGDSLGNFECTADGKSLGYW